MIQTTADDVVFSGHGNTLPEAGQVTRVPYGMELILLGPPGSQITDHLGQLLEGGVPIYRLFIKSRMTGEASTVIHTVHTAETGSVPNLVLNPPRDLNIGGLGVVPHVIGVETPTSMHDLWPRARTFMKPGRTLRVFWAACHSIEKEIRLIDGE